MSDLEMSWFGLAARLGWQMTIVVGLAAASQRWIKAGAWRRFLWQSVFLALLTIAASEFTGLGNGLAALWAQSKRPPVPAPLSGTTAPTPVRQTLSPATAPKPSPQIEPAPKAFAAMAPVSSSPARRAAWWVAGLWVLGSSIVLARLFLSVLVLELLRRRSRRVLMGPLMPLTKSLACRLGLKGTIAIYEVDRLTGPMAFGAVRRAIGVPADFTIRFDVSQQHVALAHELAHLKVADPAWYFLSDCVTALFWWHPLVWWARRRFQLACEMAADESSLVVANGPEILAHCLVELGRRQLIRGALGGLGVAGNGFRSALGQRVERLLQLPAAGVSGPARLVSFSVKLVVPLCVLGAVVGGSLWAEAGQTTSKEEEDTMQILQRSWKQSAVALTLFATLGSAEPATLPSSSASEVNSKEVYQVQSGDTLSKIVATLREQGRSLPVAGLVKENPSVNWQRLRVGQLVQLPAADAELPGAPPEPTIKEGAADGSAPGTAEHPSKLEGTSDLSSRASNRPGRQNVQGKLESIVFAEVSFDSLPLAEVVKYMIAESTKRDSGRKGVNFLLAQSKPEPGAIDPATGLPLAQVEQVDLGATTIRIVPALKQVRMVDLLEAIMRTCDRPLTYTVEDYGVVITAGHPPPPPLDLVVQTFRLDTNTYVGSLKRVFGIEMEKGALGSRGQQTILKNFFQQLGIRLEPPRSAFLNDQTGVLMVRVKSDELLVVTAAVEILGLATEPRAAEVRK